jgi:hypothetical protein
MSAFLLAGGYFGCTIAAGFAAAWQFRRDPRWAAFAAALTAAILGMALPHPYYVTLQYIGSIPPAFKLKIHLNSLVRSLVASLLFALPMGLLAAAACRRAFGPNESWIPDLPRCTACGYCLHGLTSGRCPECGRAV